MSALTFAVVLCSLVALSRACCTPDQWEGEQAALVGYSARRKAGIIKELVAVAYDASNNRSAAFIDYRNGEFSNKYKIVNRNENGKNRVYIVDLKKRKCFSKTLDRPFRKACIPSDARSVGNYSLGLKDGFKVTGYEIRGRRVEAFINVYDAGNNQCVPVTEAINGRLNKVDFVETVGFINITPGIRNATVFDIPKECRKVEDEEISLAEHLTRDHYIMAI